MHFGSAQKLAIRNYQTGDGLAHNNIKRFFQDAKGYLWIATHEGLSRFDGYGFTNYDTNNGLGHIYINDVTADNRGRLWVATNGGGVSMLVDEPDENSSNQRKKFVSFFIEEGGENNTANWVNRILFDADNRLWCVTDNGIYRAATIEVGDKQFERVMAGVTPSYSNGALRDSRGRLWFGVSPKGNLIVQITNGQLTTYEIRESGMENPAEIHSIIEDKRGRILAADLKNIYEFVEQAEMNGRGVWRKLPLALEKGKVINAIEPAPDGGLWIGGGGLIRLSDGQQTLYTTANGLSVNIVAALFYDREGNLWIGTSSGGIGKLSGDGVVSYTVAQGLPRPDVYRIIEDRSGRIYAQVSCTVIEITGNNKILPLHDGDKLIHEGCTNSQVLTQDTRGNWWFQTQRGLEFSGEANVNLQRGTLLTDEKNSPIRYTEIYEDAEGNIWLTNLQTGKLYKIKNEDDEKVPHPQLIAENVPAEFIIRDKASGTIWIANRSDIWRVSNGQIKKIDKIEGLPILQPRSLFQDAKGRVWIGTRYHGAVVTDEPNADEPRFRRYSMAEGLASNTVWRIAEDNEGRIYFGTGRGVDQLETESGKIHYFTADEGAVSASVTHLLKDRHGNIWAATVNGITRINPHALRVAQNAPPIFINQIRIAGEELPLAETGMTAIAPMEFSASQNNVSIRFVGLSFQGEDALRYQYKLEGVDTDWILAGNQREVNYANLGAGGYRFLVRAVSSNGIESRTPARFEFRILRSFYLRWWFIALASVLSGLTIYAFYRFRLNKLLEMERTRTRIATDLHDDIGTNLSKISLLSGIVNMQLANENAQNRQMLDSIAEISRESVNSMNDIVWAINPNRDSVVDMTRRMREHAEAIFVEKGVNVKFDAPVDGANLKLTMNTRRELYLIFKEAINNAMRHSDCTEIQITFFVERNEIFLKIKDDGRGFDFSTETQGNGLLNMKTRAEKIGGKFEISSQPGSGTSITIQV